MAVCSQSSHIHQLTRQRINGNPINRVNVSNDRCPMNLEGYTKEQLWQLLVEAVHASVMYPTHKAYTRDSILPQKTSVTPNELVERLGMPLGEALVILSELKEDRK